MTKKQTIGMVQRQIMFAAIGAIAFLTTSGAWSWQSAAPVAAAEQTAAATPELAVGPPRPGWDFDDEALWQFGTFGSGNIRAWTIATETGYRFPKVPLRPLFSVKADISSGDHPASNTN